MKESPLEERLQPVWVLGQRRGQRGWGTQEEEQGWEARRVPHSCPAQPGAGVCLAQRGQRAAGRRAVGQLWGEQPTLQPPLSIHHGTTAPLL